MKKNSYFIDKDFLNVYNFLKCEINIILEKEERWKK